MSRSSLAIILAAGDSTRMKSSKSKVLHEIGRLPLITHVVKATGSAGIDRIALVVGRDAQAVTEAAERAHGDVTAYEQVERKGTAHAVLAARQAIEKGVDDILVVFGDTPLVSADILMDARNALQSDIDVVVIGFRPDDPFGYGRLLEGEGKLLAIREEKDASDEERKVGFCNGGLMALNGKTALQLIDRIGNDNAKGEYYLTDIVELANANGHRAIAIEADPLDLAGINTRSELAELEAVWQQRKREKLMLDGVSMTAPETVFFAHDTSIEPDVLIEPNVVFGPGVRIESGATIHAFSHIEGAHIGSGAQVGPFARLRPGADLAESAKVGNFCEVKKAQIGKGAKVNHLTYIGDAIIGAKANIGAGTITCNYDGVNKFVTEIGTEAFIGSNSSLVAPVKIGDKAFVASGSIVTKNVPDDAVAFGRARQENKEGRASVLKARSLSIKAAKSKK